MRRGRQEVTEGHFHVQERRPLLGGAAQLMLCLCLGWLAWKASMEGRDVIWKGDKMSVTLDTSISNVAMLGFT